MSELLRLFTKNERIFFERIAHLLIFGEKTSDLLRNQMSEFSALGPTIQDMDAFKPLTLRIVQTRSSIVNSEFHSKLRVSSELRVLEDREHQLYCKELGDSFYEGHGDSFLL